MDRELDNVFEELNALRESKKPGWTELKLSNGKSVYIQLNDDEPVVETNASSHDCRDYDVVFDVDCSEIGGKDFHVFTQFTDVGITVNISHGEPTYVPYGSTNVLYDDGTEYEGVDLDIDKGTVCYADDEFNDCDITDASYPAQCGIPEADIKNLNDTCCEMGENELRKFLETEVEENLDDYYVEPSRDDYDDYD